MTPDPGRRPHPLTPIVQSWIGLVALAFFLFRDVLEHGFDPAQWAPEQLVWSLGVLGLIATGTLLMGYLSWRFTRFVLDEDGLRIDHTFIQHSSNRVLYTKIQSVDIVSPFAARLLGLAAVRVDAGGEARKIQFLGRADAEQLRDELMRRAVVARTPRPAVSSEPGAGRAPWAQPGPAPWQEQSAGSQAPWQEQPAGSQAPWQEQPAGSQAPWQEQPPGPQAPWQQPAGPPAPWQQPARVVVQVSPPQLVLAAITSAEFVMSALALVLFGLVPWLVTGEFWTAGIVVPAALGLAGFISNRVVKEWNYRLSQSPDGTVRISRGLTTTVTQTVPRDRIQGFAVSQSLLGRLVGLWRVRIEVLGYHGEEADEGGSTVLLPAGTWAQVLTALQTVWPGFTPGSVPVEPLPSRARWLRPLTFHTHRWGLDERVVLHRGGLLEHTISIVHHARAQSVRVTQGPLQRRMGLATAEVHITNGPVTLAVPSLDAEVASSLVRGELDRMRTALRGTGTVSTPFPPPSDALPDGPDTALDGHPRWGQP